MVIFVIHLDPFGTSFTADMRKDGLEGCDVATRWQGYVAGTQIAPMVVQDSDNYTGLTKVFAYAIAQHMIPTMVVIFINPGPGDSFGSERGLKYDTVSAKVGEFVQDEMIPYVRDTSQLNLTEAPNARAQLLRHVCAST